MKDKDERRSLEENIFKPHIRLKTNIWNKELSKFKSKRNKQSKWKIGKNDNFTEKNM